MARATLAPFLTSMQGKFGTASFSKGKGGTTNMRPRVKAANPRSAGQTAVRNAQSKSSKAFAAFNTATIASWAAYAAGLPQVSRKTGAKIAVQPINAYCALADKFLQVNGPSATPPTAPPTSAYSGDSVGIAATAVTGAIQFTGTAPNTAGTKTELLLQPLKGKNRKPGARGYRSKGFVAFSSGALFQNVSVPSGYYAAAYRFVNTATGQMTALTPIAVVTVALSLEDGGLDETFAQAA